jgi:tyrosine-specific transport protein
VTKSKSKVFTASLLLAGTAIGAGMLALPVTTAAGGFWPAIAIYFVCWIFSACTGLLLLEACLWLPKDSNIVSLSSHLLGRKGKYASWVLYLFLFYSLTVAYAAGGGGFVSAVTNHILPAPLSILLFILIFSPVIYIGTKAVDRLNFILMVGLITSFVIFLLIGFGKVNIDLLGNFHWGFAILSLPVVFTSFSYQGIVPSMRNYFHGEPKKVRKVIIIGSSIPFFVYIVWEYLILGIVPLEGPSGLLAAQEQGLSSVVPLKNLASSQMVYGVGQAFAFCALTTSFLGVTLGLFDFLADGLRLTKKGKTRILIYLLVYLPPTFIAMLYPKIFIRALSYAGGIGCALLLGLFPVMMVWSGRYHKNLDRRYQQVGGGKITLCILVLFILFELIIEGINELIIK